MILHLSQLKATQRSFRSTQSSLKLFKAPLSFLKLMQTLARLINCIDLYLLCAVHCAQWAESTVACSSSSTSSCPRPHLPACKNLTINTSLAYLCNLSAYLKLASNNNTQYSALPLPLPLPLPLSTAAAAA